MFSTSSANLKANCCGFGGLAPPLFCLGTSPRPSWQPPPPFGWEEVSSPANTNTVTEAKECEASTDLAFERIDVFNTAPRFHYSPETKGRWNSGRFRGENQSSPKRPRNQCKNDFGDGPVVGFTSFFWENHGTSLMKHAPKAIQKLVRFLKIQSIQTHRVNVYPPKEKIQWLDGKSTINDFDEWILLKMRAFFPAYHFLGGVFFQHNPSDKKANPTKLGERMGTFFGWNLPEWTLVGNLVDFDLLPLESFSNIFPLIVTGLHYSKLWEQLVPPADVNRTRFQQAIPRPPPHLRHLRFL